MDRAWKSALLVFLLLSVTIADGDNLSSSRAKSNEEDHLLKEKDRDDSPSIVEDENDFEGGFSSLDGMLHWAISHSDPVKLKEKAHDVQGISENELERRQSAIKELMNKAIPSDTDLMQVTIADLNNFSLPLEDRRHALNELLILVESIHNANNLKKLGGLDVIIRELSNPELEIRTTSAWILGKASQNNPVVQRQILELGALPSLMKMVKSSFNEEALKALYAVSAVISNNLDGQELFFAKAGDLILQDILGNLSADVKLLKKSASLVADLVQCKLDSTREAKLPFFKNSLFLKSLVDLTASNDLDLQEKALMAIRNLLQLRSREEQVCNDISGLDAALERLRKGLEVLMEDEHQGDYARDIDSLRREVEQIFHGKLKEGIYVPYDKDASCC